MRETTLVAEESVVAEGCLMVVGRSRVTGRITRVSGVVALVLALTTACGTTAGPAGPIDPGTPPQRESAGLGVELIGSADQPTGTAPEMTTTTDGAPAAIAPAAGSPGTRAAVPAPADRSSGSAVVAPAGVDGPGVTASTITFGVTYASDAGEANDAAGASGTDPGDVRDYYNVLVDEVNSSGGLAGRKLVPAYYETSTMSSETADSQRNAACEHWANDVKAFVVLDAISEVARSCAEKHGMVSLSGGGNAIAKTFQRYPHYFEPSGIALEDYEAATVSGLAKTDYYGKAPVIGIVTWDDPSFRTAVADGMVPELAKLGFKPKVTAYVEVPQNYAGAGGTSASVNSAILKFQQEGVTHAFIADGPSGVCLGTCLTLLWIRGASSQRYYPRYGFNDLNNPQAGMDVGFWGPDDVRGARAVMAGNFDDSSDVGIAKNQSRIDCLALMKKHGMTPDNVNARGYMIAACDRIWFLRAVLGTARMTVNRDRFVALAEALGTTYRSPATFRTELSATRHDGLAGFRRQAMDDGCGCFKFISGVYPR